MRPMIQARGIYKHYRSGDVHTDALADVSFEVQQGEFVCLMGPSGCGKSTLMNVLGLLIPPSKGELIIGGVETQKLNRTQLARFRSRAIGFIFQGFNLLEELSIIENVALPLKYSGLKQGERRHRALAVLEEVGIAHRANHTPSQLSGGQQQRAAIARALASEADIILADEPTGNLDPDTGLEIMNLLGELKRRGTTIVMVSHALRDGEFSDRIIRLDGGRLAG